jgi:transposase
MLTYGIVILHYNAHSHKAARTQALQHINWELFGLPLYSPDLASNDHHLFTNLKNWFGSQHFSNNEVLMNGVKCG